MGEGTQRVALVTGAGRGIGLATVRRLLDDGFAVALLDTSEPLLQLAADQLSADETLPVLASVTSRADVQRAIEAVIARWGRLDALVNNAGINRPGGLFEQSDTDWAAVLDVNLTGAFIVSSIAAHVIKESGGGAIVNVGSVGAAGFGASPAYAASKAGLIGLTRQMARELGPDGITVNLVAPGVTRTEWVERNLGPERMAASARAVPLQRFAEPGDIAAVIAFLASPGARHLTGQVISPSGGQWMP